MKMLIANVFCIKTSGSPQSLTAGKAENISCLHVTKQNILFPSVEFIVFI
jgi:hypothetical protein